MRKRKRNYLQYIDRFQAKGVSENATRDLVDVYRSLGQYDKAISLIDRLFQKAFGRNKAGSALYQGEDSLQPGEILHCPSSHSTAQRFQSPIHGRAAPRQTNSSTSRLSVLAKTGNVTAAKAAWQRLAAKPGTYYGLLASQQLGGSPAIDAPDCARVRDRSRSDARRMPSTGSRTGARPCLVDARAARMPLPN